MFNRVYWIILVWLFSFQTAFSETYIREYTYKASEADSKITSRAIAIDQVKATLLQEIGTHIRQKISVTKDGAGNTYASEDVEAITAGLTKIDILEEKWTGETYYLKAKIDANTDRVLNALEEFKKNRTEENQRQLKALKANQRILIKAREEITFLKLQLKEAKSKPQEQKVVAKYIKEVGHISASVMFDKGFEKYELGQYVDAIYWYLKAAEQGLEIAQYNLGRLYAEGPSEVQDYHKAIVWYRKAAEQGDTDAQSNLGQMYSSGRGVRQDERQAAAWYRKAAEQGNAVAQNNLGVMYADGIGVSQDDRQAVAWYRKAAEQGNALAQKHLGMMYLDGRGVDQDKFQAVAWLRKASEQGLDNAQYNLGLMYAHGEGVKQDDRQAVAWYRKAAAQGNSGAQTNLGYMYAEGRGVRQDDGQAVAWYLKAAEQEDANAQKNLGVMYANGTGVRQDKRIAKKWFGKGCDGGHQVSCDYYKRLNMQGY